jgi:hypothetical protein
MVFLYPRWSEFLEQSYDAIGEYWGWSTQVHGWSCMPTRDMIFSTRDQARRVRVHQGAHHAAPRTTPAAKGSVPTPHHLIFVEASGVVVSVAAKE